MVLFWTVSCLTYNNLIIMKVFLIWQFTSLIIRAALLPDLRRNERPLWAAINWAALTNAKAFLLTIQIIMKVFFIWPFTQFILIFWGNYNILAIHIRHFGTNLFRNFVALWYWKSLASFLRNFLAFWHFYFIARFFWHQLANLVTFLSLKVVKFNSD